MNLPSFLECVDLNNQGLATPLHQFILDNEPAGDDGKVFRNGLEKLIEYIKEMD